MRNTKNSLKLLLPILNENLGKERNLEVSFTETVSEHLKLARDEGARITATAIAEAEKMDEAEAHDFSELRDAINDISSKDSQSEILKALVNQAAAFTPRGAFFIVKNEHLVGWRVFGREDHQDPKIVREVFFPVSTKTALSAAVETLSTVSESESDGESEDNVMYRTKLGFDTPEQMYAIPLIARGRGVAVMYADNGEAGDSVNISALETLMRVAGLTVEVLASAPQVSRQKEDAYTIEGEESDHDVAKEPATEAVESGAEVTPEPQYSVPEPEVSYSEEYSVEAEEAPVAVEPESSDEYQFQPIAAVENEYAEPEAATEEVEYQSEFEPVETEFTPADPTFAEPVSEYVESDSEYVGPEVSEESEEAPAVSFSESSWDQAAPEAEADSEDQFAPDESFTADESYNAAEEPFAAETTESFSFKSEESSTFEVYDSSISEPYSEPEVADSPSGFEFESNAESPAFEPTAETAEFEAEAPEPDQEYSFEAPSESADEFEASYDDSPTEELQEAVEAPVEEVVEASAASAPPVRKRFADRNLDLPIEVAEDERRLHNDARRFARLLVSEIKLYNEQKVKEGRESSDLYERLREAIDRSREMYDKRVQPPVAQKFDYFNYELVNTLAEGDEIKLGTSYPGPSI